MEFTGNIEIAVTPEAAFAAVSDLAAMGRRSPENTGGEWLTPGPALGARFLGTNERDGDAWSTVATVTDFDPPRLFAFEVEYEGLPVSRWEYRIEATATGCRIVEWTEDRRGPELRDEDDDREAFTPHSVKETLEALKRELEDSAQA